MKSRWWFLRWLCPKCGQVFILPKVDVQGDLTHKCSWCGELVRITGNEDGSFQGLGHLIEKFPRLDVTSIQQRDQAWPE
jgi:phage FluMu protein Com